MSRSNNYDCLGLNSDMAGMAAQVSFHFVFRLHPAILGLILGILGGLYGMPRIRPEKATGKVRALLAVLTAAPCRSLLSDQTTTILVI